MGGLLTRVVGGALTGAGSAMVDQAKAAREDALLAMKRGQEVEDRDTKIAADKANLDTTERGATDRANNQNDTSKQIAYGNNLNQLTITGANNVAAGERNAATIGAEDTRQGKLIQANKDAADAAAGRYGKPEADQNGNLIATNQNGKAITIVGADGKSVVAPNSKIPGEAMKVIADKSVDADGNFDMPTFMSNLQQAEKVYGPGGQTAVLPPPTPPATGGYLSNLWGAVTGSPNQAQPTGGGLVRSPDSKNAVSPPANGPKRINNTADYNAVPSGAQYIDPAGTLRTKP